MIDCAGIMTRLKSLELYSGEYAAITAALERHTNDQVAVAAVLKSVAIHLAAAPTTQSRHHQLAADIRLLLAE